MNKQDFVARLYERARGKHDRSIVKKDVEAFLDVFREVVLKEVLLKADKLNVSGLGQFSARWVESKLKPGEMHLVAHFDYDAKAEAAVFAARLQ